MGLLTFLRLRRRDEWEPLTVLDHILISPLQWLVTMLYHIMLFLRGRPFSPPPGRPHIRVVCVSDTHDRMLRVPDGDLLIHAGDLTDDGTVESIQRQVDWLADMPHRHKIVVCGNHDSWFDDRSRKAVDRRSGKSVNWKGVRYLQGELVTLSFKGGRRLNIYGAPGVPKCGDDTNAFQYDREKHPWRGRVPEETDVLITHTPPRFHRDLNLGCDGLLEEVWRVKPKLHVFGHVHWGHGRESVFFDECQRAYESLMSRTGRGLIYDLLPSSAWVDALSVAWYGFVSIVWKWVMLGPGSNNGALMVNAAVMYGNTGRVRNPATVVKL
ncbi:hypothetical protein OQA88_7816 [Cercophora sp. LCS_1]